MPEPVALSLGVIALLKSMGVVVAPKAVLFIKGLGAVAHGKAWLGLAYNALHLVQSAGLFEAAKTIFYMLLILGSAVAGTQLAGDAKQALTHFNNGDYGEALEFAAKAISGGRGILDSFQVA